MQIQTQKHLLIGIQISRLGVIVLLFLLLLLLFLTQN